MVLDSRRHASSKAEVRPNAHAPREGRRVPRRDRREDEGAGPLRLHHRPGVRRPGPVHLHLREDHRAHGGGVDVVSGIINSHLIMAAAVQRNGTEAQKRHYLPRFATRRAARRHRPHRARRGHRPAGDPHRAPCATATTTWSTAPRPGSPTACTATPSRCWSRPTRRPKPRHKGMSLFIAEKGPGFNVTRKLEKLGYRGIDTCELLFDDYRVPADRLIGGVEGSGLQQVLSGLELGRINVAARGVGVARGGAAGSRGLCAAAQDLRQADLRAPGHPAEARRDGHARRGRAAAGRVGRARLRPRRALRHGGGHGEVLRHRGGDGERARVHAHPRRLRLLARSSTSSATTATRRCC